MVFKPTYKFGSGSYVVMMNKCSGYEHSDTGIDIKQSFSFRFNVFFVYPRLIHPLKTQLWLLMRTKCTHTRDLISIYTRRLYEISIGAFL
jgi:hypothetical protein